jgi:hypothetical protein
LIPHALEVETGTAREEKKKVFGFRASREKWPLLNSTRFYRNFGSGQNFVRVRCNCELSELPAGKPPAPAR